MKTKRGAKPDEAESRPGERAQRRVFSAERKAEAVLAIWSGSRTATEVCEEMEIAWAMVSQWEERALRAMLEAFRPRRRPREERGPLLPGRLMDLLDKKSLESASRLDKRLRKVQKEAGQAKG